MPFNIDHYKDYFTRSFQKTDALFGERLQHFTHFAYAGFPTPQSERWRTTNLKSLIAHLPFDQKQTVSPLTKEALPAPLLANAYRLVLIDGAFVPSLSDDLASEGITLRDLSSELNPEDLMISPFYMDHYKPSDLSFIRLNRALCQTGFHLNVPAEVTVSKPIEIVCLTTKGDQQYHPQIKITLGENSDLTILERHESLDPEALYFANYAISIEVSTKATLRHYQLQNQSNKAFHIENMKADLQEDSHYQQFILTTGSSLARQEIQALLCGKKADVHISGAYLINDTQLSDVTSFIEHQAEQTKSRQVYKGVIAGSARGVFQGKIYVDSIAQKTDGYQLNRALLLSETAQINSKPELEIYADDVKCSHGATSGYLNDDALFYLQSRGIPESEAKKMLITAFLEESLQEITHDETRAAFSKHIEQTLQQLSPLVNPAFPLRQGFGRQVAEMTK